MGPVVKASGWWAEAFEVSENDWYEKRFYSVISLSLTACFLWGIWERAPGRSPKKSILYSGDVEGEQMVMMTMTESRKRKLAFIGYAWCTRYFASPRIFFSFPKIMSAVILNQGQFCLWENICQRLETFYFHNQGCHWHLVGGAREASDHSSRYRIAPRNENWPKMSKVLRLTNPAWRVGMITLIFTDKQSEVVRS